MGRGLRAFVVLCVIVAACAIAIRRWLSPAADYSPPAEGRYRIATYNLGWLLDESSEARYRNLVTVIESIEPHILAVQEVESKEAFLRVLPQGYEVAIADDPLEDQELGLAVRAPFRIRSHKVLFASRRYDYAFPGRRNVLEVEVDSPSGPIHFYVIHFKSRGGGRLESDPARVESSRLLLDYFEQNGRDRLVVLGDFNDTPGDDSLNILESGDPLGGRTEGAPGSHLVNLFQEMYEDDYVTQGFFRQYRGKPTTPVMRGASEDNDRLRGRDYNFPNDVKVTEALFDQILVSPSLAESVVAVEIYGGRAAVEGKHEYVTRRKDGEAEVRYKGTLPSDHLPAFADVKLP